MGDVTLRGGIGAESTAELDVKRSRFICRLERVGTEEQARQVIDSARKQHWNARHHCSAFILGSSTMPNQVRRSNDDGEPSGTAGRPMLDVMVGRGLMDCVAVVSRHFGGTLLGTGGLIRAYSDAVGMAVDAAVADDNLVARRLQLLFTLELEHSTAGRVESDLRQRGFTIVGTEYGRVALLTISTAESERAALSAAVADATAGGSQMDAAGSRWIDVER
ncbi:MAG: IMPACT family protein [Rhodoglobus sp.]